MSLYEARVICDSVSPAGVRLTTLLLRYPRIIHAEVMTHRVFSRSFESSRAMPSKKRISRVESQPFVPLEWGLNQGGTTQGAAIEDRLRLDVEWLRARDAAVQAAKFLDGHNVHKGLVNRMLEPWDTITGVVTSTRWRNFELLRTHKTAEQHIRKVASMVVEARKASVPVGVNVSEWHLPFIEQDELKGAHDLEILKKCSAARCARVSLLNHEGKRPGVEEDLKLFDRLATRNDYELEPGHWTPLEHQATPIPRVSFPEAEPDTSCEWCWGDLGKRPVALEHVPGRTVTICEKCGLGHATSGNLVGWRQFRKEFPQECLD